VRRVLHFTAARTAGGLIGHLRLLAPLTAERGWESTVMIPEAPALDAAAGAMARDGLALHRGSVAGKGDLRGLLAFRRTLRDLSPDLLHVHLASPFESLPVILGTPRARGPRIVTTEHAPSHHPLEHPWSRAAKRLAGRRVNRVIALSARDADLLVRSFGLPVGRIRAIPNGVAIPPSRDRVEARRRLGIPENRPVLAYAGEIVETKGLGDLIDALAILARGSAAVPAPLAVLAGEGPFASEIPRRAGAAGIGDLLRLAGRLDPPTDLLAACDLFVLPSHAEAMPLALLEAMAAGRPVIASRVGGIPDVVREGIEGLLVPARDPAALAVAIGRLLSDAALRERMGEAARARVEASFSARAMADATCALYDEVARGGRP